MKKIMMLCMVMLLSVTILGCSGSADEKNAKKVVSDYLDCLFERDWETAAAMTGEKYNSDLNENETYKRTADIMLNRLEYKITDVNVEDTNGTVSVELSNVNYTNLVNTANSVLLNEVDDMEALNSEELGAKKLEIMERLLPDADIVTQTVLVNVTKDEDAWKLSSDNTKFNKAINGE